jgi:hypothetical protein
VVGQSSETDYSGPVSSLRVPGEMKARYDAIVALTDKFAAAHLDEEYAALCRRMAATLCRKRPSPLERGQVAGWAAGIVHALCTVNFGFDPSQQPHTTPRAISQGFGVGDNAPSTKSKTIRDLLDLHPMDPDWTLPSQIGENPLIWLIEVNGLLVDARMLPRELQELALAQGAIPYIPGEGP